jgi:transcriptional regulator with XRE-family HTH domain
MEFHEKLQELRKKRGLTQEELAQILYVSRAAVSKWESGRGYPNIDSLKALAQFYTVTIDDLLSGNEILTIAEEDNRQKQTQLRSLVFGLLDLSIILFFFLPFFRHQIDGFTQAVSIPALTGISPYLIILYYLDATITILLGLLNFALQIIPFGLWHRNKHLVSLFVNAGSVLLFILSMQPYAAAFQFLFFTIKGLLLIKTD